MRLVVIGGAGYLGSVLTRQLLEHGDQVSVLDRFMFGRESLEDLHSHPHLKIIDADMRDIRQVTACTADADAVILLAALVGEAACDADPKAAVDTNLFAAKAVAEACKYYGVGRFIFASTDSVYGIREGIMLEDSEMNPISLYARLKLQAEREILSIQDGVFRPTVLRMSTLYGYSPRMRFDLVVNALAMHATLNGRIKIFGGKQWRPFVHVADAARAYVRVLEAPPDTVGGQLFNVGSNNQNYRIEQVGEQVKRLFPNITVETIPQTPDLRNYAVSCDKIARALGYTPERSIVDGIQEIQDILKSGVIPNPMDNRFYNVHPR